MRKCVALWLFLSLVASSAALNPILLVPGLTCSVLETKMHKTSVPHAYCEKHIKDWSRIWLSLPELAPDLVDCFVDTVTVHYDINTNNYHNTKGVEIQAADFGGMGGLYSLDPAFPLKAETILYGHLIDFLEKKLGYVERETLFGATYDWRMAAPDQLETNGMFAKLDSLVEEAYTKTGLPVYLMGHSMGAPFAHMYLTTHTPEAWKQKYIAGLITLGGPFGGASDATEYSLCGTKWRIPISMENMKAIMRHMGSVAWMMPRGPAFEGIPIVSTPQRNYTAADLQQLYTDGASPEMAAILSHVQPFVAETSFLPPGVPTYIVYSLNQTTSLTFFEPEGPTCGKGPTSMIATRPGDGTVPDLSLLSFKYWKTQPQPVVPIQVSTDHVAMLSDPEVHEAIRNIVMPKQ
ncbi:putative group XV phospholipase A2 [Paratrimastix pyriformis]|uniref:Group XV phospholipase A2 n=1 Tax=Paratrimastix pyriformis TaxID=342808 RepID=A0ABQ8UTP1_9EUKA|nr:putative group XV phospholipase A2 [Paratrimastix pyriformis]